MDANVASAIGVILVVADFVIRITALIIIPRGRKPTAAMAWLLAIFLIPFVGVVLFLLIGTARWPKARMRKQRAIDRMIVERTEQRAHAIGATIGSGRDSWPEWFAPLVHQNQVLGALPAMGGGSAQLIGDYQESLDSMAEAIDSATWFVHVEFYIVSWDSTTRGFFAALERAVKRGVSVRLLADHVASRRTVGHDETFAELDRIGVSWSYMLPVRPLKGQYQRPDLRNHRKLVVVDGLVGFTGSQNLIDRSYRTAKNIKRGLQWQELMTRVTGPVVTGLNGVFIADWYLETDELLADAENLAVAEMAAPAASDSLVCQVVPSGPGYDAENGLRLFLTLVTSAREKVIITSPYFVPDEAMMYAITSACFRGLDVQLFVSEIGDQGSVWRAQRSYYTDLLRAGVTIWLYPAPFILHSKHLSIDGDVAVIGSSNMDIRSFTLNAEVSLLVYGRSFVEQMRGVEQGYRDAGRRLTAEDWAKEPASATVFDGIARLTSALK